MSIQRAFLLVAAISCLSVSDVIGQLPQIRLDAIAPVGAKVGTELDVAVKAGADLDELNALLF